MAKSIKVYDYAIIEHKGKTTKLEHICDIWEAFGWDIENDKEAKTCADLITRELICWGDFKTNDDLGREIYIKLVKEEDNG